MLQYLATLLLSVFLLVISVPIISAAKTTMSGFNGIVLSSPHTDTNTAPSATVILMHGLGDSAEGLRPIAEHWLRLFPYVKFVLPTAPKRKVSMNGGREMNAWYDIIPGVERTVETSPGIVDSARFVRTLIEAELAAGRPLERIVLAGFSQGGSMSLFTALQAQFVPGDGHLGGLVVLSGILPRDDKLQVEDRLRGTKVLHCHGTADRMLPIQLAEDSHRRAVAQGVKSYDLKPFPGAGHGVSREMLQEATLFLGEVLPPLQEVAVN